VTRACTALAAVLGLLLGSAPLSAQPRIAYLGFQGVVAEKSRLYEAFLEGLRERGYAPGRDLRIDTRLWKNMDELRSVSREVAGARPALVVVGPPIAAAMMREASPDTPIVCISCGDPVENGLAKTLAHPQGNVTGLASLSAELIGKRFELVRELLPTASRVAVVTFPANPGTPPTIAALQRIERNLRMTIKRVEVTGRGDLAAAFRSASVARSQAIVIQDDPLVRSAAAEIAGLARKHRVPVVAGLSETVEAGALLSYGPNRIDMSRRSAVWVEKILKGTMPGELPFEQARRLELIINLQTAKALGLSVPRDMLSRADRVIFE